MPVFKVSVVMSVSAVVDVEADSIEEALDTYYESNGMPGRITVGAFGPVDVDESGDWEAVSIIDESGDEVWAEDLDKHLYDRIDDLKDDLAKANADLARLRTIEQRTRGL